MQTWAQRSHETAGHSSAAYGRLMGTHSGFKLGEMFIPTV